MVHPHLAELTLQLLEGVRLVGPVEQRRREVCAVRTARGRSAALAAVAVAHRCDALEQRVEHPVEAGDELGHGLDAAQRRAVRNEVAASSCRARSAVLSTRAGSGRTPLVVIELPHDRGGPVRIGVDDELGEPREWAGAIAVA